MFSKQAMSILGFAQVMDFVSMKWYSYSGHLEKRVIGTKFLEVRHDNKEKELFETI